MLCMLFVPLASLASSNGAPNGYSGAPGEGNCTQCHAGTVNSGDGLFMISGPATFLPGQTLEIEISLQDSGQSRWGFQLTDQGVGSFSLTDPANTQLSGSYVKQRSAGTYAGNFDGPVSWSVNWTAPADPAGAVTLYAAGNAANGNFANSGDHIYTSSLTMNLALLPVSDLIIQYTGNAAELNWSPVAGAAAYRVERADALGTSWQPIATVTTAFHADAFDGARALYRVIALSN